MTFQIVLAQRAVQDLSQALRWLHENRSAKLAEQWYSEIFPAIDTLQEFPDRCPVAIETEADGPIFRQLHFGVRRRTTHRIIFTIAGTDVFVLRVRHVAQRELSPDELL